MNCDDSNDGRLGLGLDDRKMLMGTTSITAPIPVIPLWSEQQQHHASCCSPAPTDLLCCQPCLNDNTNHHHLDIIQKQERIKRIDDEMNEMRNRMLELIILRQKEEEQQKQQRPDFSEHIQVMEDQMRQMQDMFSRFATSNSSSADTTGQKNMTVIAEESEEQGQEDAPPPELTKVTLRKHEKECAQELNSYKRKEDETEATYSVDSAEEDYDNDYLVKATESTRGSGSFKTRLFGRRKKSPARTLKKAYAEQMDQEIACMRDELRELELSGLLPSDDKTNKVQRSRPGSPSWGRSMLGKKSPPKKKARNRSPGR